MFPFEREILIAEAEWFIKRSIVTKDVYKILEDTLYYDPNSARILAMYMQYANHYGNKNEAQMAFKKLELIAPNSNVLQVVKTINPKGY